MKSSVNDAKTVAIYLGDDETDQPYSDDGQHFFL
jgi:hypothetical protein